MYTIVDNINIPVIAGISLKTNSLFNITFLYNSSLYLGFSLLFRSFQCLIRKRRSKYPSGICFTRIGLCYLMLHYFMMLRYFKIKDSGRTAGMLLSSRGKETPEALPHAVQP